jgi:hypothetical protein
MSLTLTGMASRVNPPGPTRLAIPLPQDEVSSPLGEAPVLTSLVNVALRIKEKYSRARS